MQPAHFSQTGVTLMTVYAPNHLILSKKKLALKRLAQKMLREMALHTYMQSQVAVRT
jgi:hypothetical protein